MPSGPMSHDDFSVERSLIEMRAEMRALRNDMEEVKAILTEENPDGLTLKTRVVLLEHHQADSVRKQRDLTAATFTFIGLVLANGIAYAIQLLGTHLH